MTLPDLDQNSPEGKYLTEAMYLPRVKAWSDCLHEIVTGTAVRSGIIESLRTSNATPEQQEWLPDFIGWAEGAYYHLMDEGPVEQVRKDMRGAFAMSRFMRTQQVSILIPLAKPILTAPLPKFRGLTAPECTLRWDALASVLDCIPVGDAIAFQFKDDWRGPDVKRGDPAIITLPDDAEHN